MDNTSDSDSVNSDDGIRYKTNSVRSNQDVKYDSFVEDNQSFGPSLPLHLHKNTSIGPALPPKPQEKIAEVVGPMLPPYLQKTKEIEIEESKVIGPALPPHLMKSQESVSPPKTLGPSLPPHLQKPLQNDTSIGPALPPHLQSKNLPKETPESKCFGPSLPDHLRQQLAQVAESQSEEEEDVYGPVPVGFSGSKAHIELEERALQMKIDMLNPKGEKEPTREEWMLELPAAKATHFGLGPRQFRAKEAPDMSDRSSWTDTPEDRSKKKAKKGTKEVDLQKETEIKEMKRRDKEQEAIVKKSKRSKESLVDMHMKKMKKDKDDSGPAERRPFSREVDLQVNRFDEAAKKAVLKKAQLLDTRFSAGQSKFL